MKNLTKFVAQAAVVSFSAALSAATPPKQTNQSIQFVYNDVAFEVSGPLSPAQIEFVKAVRKNPGAAERIAMSEIVRRHLTVAHAGSVKQLTDFIRALPESKDPRALKLAIESAIAKTFAPKELQYDADKVSVFQILNENLMQCYSGSYLYSFAAQSRLPKSDRTFLMMRPGHIQPAFIGKNDAGDTRVFGLETTVSDLGLTDYGALQDELQPDAIPIETDLSFVSDLFVGRIRNALDVRREIIEASARHLGIRLNRDAMKNYEIATSQGSGPQAQLSAAQTVSSNLNASLLAFGSSHAPTGPVPRSRAKTLSPKTQPGAIYERALFAGASEPKSAEVASSDAPTLLNVPGFSKLTADLRLEEALEQSAFRDLGCEADFNDRDRILRAIRWTRSLKGVVPYLRENMNMADLNKQMAMIIKRNGDADGVKWQGDGSFGPKQGCISTASEDGSRFVFCNFDIEFEDAKKQLHGGRASAVYLNKTLKKLDYYEDGFGAKLSAFQIQVCHVDSPDGLPFLGQVGCSQENNHFERAVLNDGKGGARVIEFRENKVTSPKTPERPVSNCSTEQAIPT